MARPTGDSRGAGRPAAGPRRRRRRPQPRPTARQPPPRRPSADRCGAHRHRLLRLLPWRLRAARAVTHGRQARAVPATAPRVPARCHGTPTNGSGWTGGEPPTAAATPPVHPAGASVDGWKRDRGRGGGRGGRGGRERRPPHQPDENGIGSWHRRAGREGRGAAPVASARRALSGTASASWSSARRPRDGSTASQRRHHTNESVAGHDEGTTGCRGASRCLARPGRWPKLAAIPHVADDATVSSTGSPLLIG